MKGYRWLFLFLLYTAHGYSAMLKEFPPDAVPITEELFVERVAGQSFSGVTDSGSDWRMEFSKDGTFVWYYSVDSFDIGKWTIEGNKFCGAMRRTPSTCNEFRAKDDLIFYKRISNGEVVRLTNKIVAEGPGEIGPYVGSWSVAGPRVKDARLVITDAKGGTWKTYASQLQIKEQNLCWSDTRPVKVQGIFESRIVLLIQGSEALRGCEDIVVSLRRFDGGTLRGTVGGGPVVAERNRSF